LGGHAAREGPIHVTVPGDSSRKRRAGLIIHRSRTLTPELTAFKTRVRITTPARTLAGLRPGLDAELHDRATRRALDLGLISRASVHRDTALARSRLERRFLALCRRHGLPKPVVNARIGRYEVDFLRREPRVVVEADSFEFHGTREAFERDRAKDADLQARGYRVLRITHRQLLESPRKVARLVKGLLGAALPAP
jgi:very-short-patch-repair endonuclease